MTQPPDKHEGPSFIALIAEFWLPLTAGLVITLGILTLSTGDTQPNGTLYFMGGLLTAIFLFIALYSQIEKKPEQRKEYIFPQPAPYVPPAPVEQPAPEAAAAPAETKAEEKAAEAEPEVTAPPSVDYGDKVVILWGSESGNCEGLAEVAKNKLSEQGITAVTVDMEKVKASDLPGMHKLLVITSTWGDGDPPSNAIALHASMAKADINLSGTIFSVCALGDTNYDQFCKFGKDMDEYLAAKGAKRVFDRVDCDLDYDAPFAKWLAGASNAVKGALVSA